MMEKKEKQMIGRVVYKGLDGSERLLEWGGKQIPEWVAFERLPDRERYRILDSRGGDINWYPLLLNQFGLDPREFSPSEIFTVSPRELIKARKAKIREYSLDTDPHFREYDENGDLREVPIEPEEGASAEATASS